MIHILIEVVPKGEMSETTWKVVNKVIELVSKGQTSERRRKVCDWKIK